VAEETGFTVGRAVTVGRGVTLTVGTAVGRTVGFTVGFGIRGVAVRSGAGVPGTMSATPSSERPASRMGW
jgi:tetrahydromethanopterin S-methyltransferase subunit F